MSERSDTTDEPNANEPTATRTDRDGSSAAGDASDVAARPTRRRFLGAVAAGVASGIAGLSGATTADAAPGGLTNEYAGDKAGIYYLRQVTDHPANVDQPLVFTYGELAPDERDGLPCEVPPSANVFFGQRNGSTIEGRWVDVPKGVNANYGRTYALEIRDLNSPESTKLEHTAGPGHNDTFTSLPRTTCNGGRCTTTPVLRPPNPENVAAFREWPSSVRRGVTGTWRADDGGTYYLRQLPSGVFGDDTVVWFGENAGSFANVFWGTRTAGRITGTWADVPKEGMRNVGTLELEIRNDGTLRKTDDSGAIFGGRRWRRVEPTCGYDPDADFEAATGERRPEVDPTPTRSDPPTVEPVDPARPDAVTTPSEISRPQLGDDDR